MLACGDSGVPTPAALSPVGELALAGVVGEVLPAPLTVKVADNSGNPVAGVVVTFAVADGGGSLSRTADTTTLAGVASTSWRLGDRTTAQRVTATVTGITPINFVATARAAAPATISIDAGDAQAALSNASLATAPSVVVRDRFTNPVPGITVTFTVAVGGGAVTNAANTTNASGVATAGGWRLGAGTGVNRLTALAIASGITNNPVTFNAIATSGAPATAAAQGQTTNLSAVVGQLLTPVPSIRVLDANGNPVQGTSVTFTASTGSTVLAPSKLTDANGVAAPDGWQLGAVAQPYTLTATAGTLPSVTFTASARAAAAASVTINAGNNQLSLPGRPVPTEPSVRVVDGLGNPVPGAEVNFAVVTGGGAASGRRVVTGADGIAAVGAWTLGDAIGVNTLRATVTGDNIAGNPLTFTANGTAGAAAALTPTAGNAVTGQVATAIALAPSVTVRDARGNPVSGAAVTFTPGPLSGSVTGGSVPSNASGVAAVTTWTLGSVAGTQTLIARSAGLPDVVLTVTATAGPAALLAPNGTPTQQAAVVGTSVTPVPSIRVFDAQGNGVPGVTVTFASSAGATLIGGSKVTDGTGAAAPDSWVLGSIAQNYTLTAAAGTLTPVVFTATARGVAAASVAINAGNNQSTPAGRPVAIEPSVRVVDGSGNPVAGAEVNFAVLAGNGSATGRRVLTGADGIAAVGGWTLGDAAGTNTLRATVTGDNIAGNPVTFLATGTAGTAATIAPTAGNALVGQVATALLTSPSVTVRDARGNPVSGVIVTFTPGPLSGSVTGGLATTNASGVATVTTWTLGAVAGTQTLVARVAGLPDVVFSALAAPGAAVLIASNGVPTQQVAVVGTNVTPAPSVRVFDAQGNGVPGVTVAFASSTGSTVTGGSKTTDNNGVAAPDAWALGTQARTYTLTASTGSLTTVSFSVAARAGAASAAAIADGNNQSATVGSAVAIEPSVRVVDQFGNPVGGIEVVFDVTSGGGTAVARRPVTNSDGVATVGGWTLGRISGSNNNTLRATVSGTGITGNPLTFTASGTAGTATGLAVSTGNNQTAVVATQLPTNPTVIVRDAQSNPVPGVVVTFTPATNSGGVAGTSTGTPAGSVTATTDATGIASVFWTLGQLAGTQTLVASADGLSNVSFTATASVGAPANIVVLSGTGQSAVVNTNIAIQPVVQIRDAFNNVVVGATVVFSTVNTGASVSGASVTSNSLGQASPTAWTMGTAIGTQTLTVTSGAATTTVTATATAGAATALQIVSGNGQTRQASQGLLLPLRVRLIDAFGNPVTTSGTAVTFAVTAGGGAIAGGSVNTTAGDAQSGTWTLGAAGAQTVSVTSPGLTGVTFTATIVP
jgi:adhesin/invasin